MDENFLNDSFIQQDQINISVQRNSEAYKELDEKKEKEDILLSGEINKIGPIQEDDTDGLQIVKLKTEQNNRLILRNVNGPRFIGMDERFATIRTKMDDYKIAKIRSRLKNYHEVKHAGVRSKYLALKDLDKACSDYTFMSFSLFRGKSGARLLEEVRGMRKEIKTELRKVEGGRIAKLSEKKGEKSEDAKLRDKRWAEVRIGGRLNIFARAAAGLVGLTRFVVENPIRLALKAVTLPFWAINEVARGVVKATGHRPHRHIKFPGLHSPSTYYARTIRSFRRWFAPSSNFGIQMGGKEAYQKSLHNNEGRGSKWYEAFLTDYKHDSMISRSLAEEEEMIAESLSGKYDTDYDEEDDDDQPLEETNGERVSVRSSFGPDDNIGKIEF